MEQLEIIKGNKMIADFMGTERIIGYTGCDTDIPYHQDWSRLMHALEKICRTKVGDGVEYVEYATPRTFGMLNEDGQIMVRLNGHQLQTADTLIEATWMAVVQFIEWKNSKP